MSTKLPKHIALMVEKNNLVMAIKTLSEEKNISMGEAKAIIDDFESHLKDKQRQKVEAIASKQEKKQTKTVNVHNKQNTDQIKNLNQGLDNHLEHIGYKKPAVPYWMKRLLVILVVIAVLSVLFWQLMP